MSGRRRGDGGKNLKIISGFSVLIFVLMIIFFLPALKSLIYQKVHRGFLKQVDQNALSANIKKSN